MKIYRIKIKTNDESNDALLFETLRKVAKKGVTHEEEALLDKIYRPLTYNDILQNDLFCLFDYDDLTSIIFEPLIKLALHGKDALTDQECLEYKKHLKRGFEDHGMDIHDFLENVNEFIENTNEAWFLPTKNKYFYKPIISDADLNKIIQLVKQGYELFVEKLKEIKANNKK